MTGPARFIVLFLFSAVAASAQEPAPPSLESPRPSAVLASGDAGALSIETDRNPLADGDGFRMTVTVTNRGPEPAVLAAVELLGDAACRLEAPALLLRALTFDGARSLVTPLAQPVVGMRFVAIADATRKNAIVASFADSGGADGARTTVGVRPRDDGSISLSASVVLDPPLSLSPSSSFTAPALTVVRGGDAWFALADLFPPEPLARDGVAARVEWLRAHGDPLVPRDDGSPAANPGGRPLDLFGNPLGPYVWHLDPRPPGLAGGVEIVVLRNTGLEPTVAGFWFNDVGIPPGLAVDATDGAGRTLGRYRNGLLLPLAGGETSALELRPAGPLDGPGCSVLVVDVDEYGARGTVRAVDPADPALAERLAARRAAGGAGGALLVDLASDGALSPPPPICFALGVSRIFPYRVVAPPAKLPVAANARFATRAANVEYRIGWRPQALEAPVWLAADDAGFRATPLQAVLADSVPAARGFFTNSGPLAVLIAVGLGEEELHRIADLLCDPQRRAEVINEAGLARAAVRSSKEPAGLFRELKLPRLRKDDLVPADAASARDYTASVSGAAEPAVRELICEAGERVREDVVNLGGLLSIVIDVPQPLVDSIAMVVRRAPTPRPRSYHLLVNSRVVGSVTPQDEDPTRWVEDVFVIPPEEFAAQWRAQLGIATGGGSLAIARAAFFRVKAGRGPLLASLPIAAGTASVDRAAAGGHLRVGGVAYLSGLGLAAPGAVEFDLGGRFSQLTGVAGVDAASPEGSAARVVVKVDGTERARIDRVSRDKPAAALRVDVSGGRRLRIEVEPLEGTPPGAGVDVCDARLADG